MVHGERNRFTPPGMVGPTPLVLAAVLVSTSVGLAAVSPEAVCQSGRARAAGKYARCVQSALARFDLTADLNAYNVAAGKCVTKYADTWAKLQAKASASGATCDSPRFTDNGDGTVMDRLTGLQWEKKSDDSTVHDKDNSYSWSAGGTAADGTAFTSFLSTLNSGGCFAGQCDWRLPSRDELLTIVAPSFPTCTTGPCIAPAFGPTAAGAYWSATTRVADPLYAWHVTFSDGEARTEPAKSVFSYVRAVRDSGS
jgi:hypothetical protein